MDVKRKLVLGYARDMSPLDTVGRISLLRRTVIPRLLSQWLLWVIWATFAVTATVSRLGYGSDPIEANRVLEGGGTFVAFMVIFYVGYCYQRYEAQFEEVQMIMHHIVNACLEARVAFDDQEEVFRLWRYLNLMHTSAYCGLTEELTEDNFFMPLCEKHAFLGEPGSDCHKREKEALRKIDLDDDGARACSMYEVWAFEVIKQEQIRGGPGFTPPIHASLVSEVRGVGNHIKKLFACRYQVLPFIYTHLVSAASTLFLMFGAFVKALNFDPDAAIGEGFVLPFMATILSTLTTFGLLEVGNTILDPFGTDPEDFALLHFVEWTASASFQAISIEHVGPRSKDSAPFYTESEIAAATKIFRSVVRRYRWNKLISELTRRSQLSLKKKRMQASLSSAVMVTMASGLAPSSASSFAAPDSAELPSAEIPGTEIPGAEIAFAPGSAHGADGHAAAAPMNGAAAPQGDALHGSTDAQGQGDATSKPMLSNGYAQGLLYRTPAGGGDTASVKLTEPASGPPRAAGAGGPRKRVKANRAKLDGESRQAVPSVEHPGRQLSQSVGGRSDTWSSGNLDLAA